MAKKDWLLWLIIRVIPQEVVLLSLSDDSLDVFKEGFVFEIDLGFPLEPFVGPGLVGAWLFKGNNLFLGVVWVL